MEPPASLPGQLYLLAYDLRRGRVTARMQLGYLIRAGALTELLLDGHIADADRGPRAVSETVADPVLDAVLRQIVASRRRSWKHWVGKGTRRAARGVRDQLESGGWIRVERRRLLGLIPVAKVTVRDPRVVRRLASRVSSTLRGGVPISRVDRRDAALVALAAEGGLKIILPRTLRRTHKRRIAELSDLVAPIPGALHKAIQEAQAAAAG
jgi:hypothetical protein